MVSTGLACAQELDPQPEKGREDAAFEDAGKAGEDAAPMEEEAASGSGAEADGEQAGVAAEQAQAEAEPGMEADNLLDEPAVPEIRLADARNGDPGALHHWTHAQQTNHQVILSQYPLLSVNGMLGVRAGRRHAICTCDEMALASNSGTKLCGNSVSRQLSVGWCSGRERHSDAGAGRISGGSRGVCARAGRCSAVADSAPCQLNRVRCA